LPGVRRISSWHALLVACGRGKMEEIFGLVGSAHAIHINEKFRKKWLDKARYEVLADDLRADLTRRFVRFRGSIGQKCFT
jgi:hypothetical protein